VSREEADSFSINIQGEILLRSREMLSRYGGKKEASTRIELGSWGGSCALPLLNEKVNSTQMGKVRRGERRRSSRLGDQIGGSTRYLPLWGKHILPYLNPQSGKKAREKGGTRCSRPHDGPEEKSETIRPARPLKKLTPPVA